MIINLHPPLTALPIGCLFIVCVLEICLVLGKATISSASPSRFVSFAARVARVEVVTFALLLFGLVTVLTFFSGYHGLTFAHRCTAVDEAALVAHQVWGRAVLFLAIPMVLLGIVRFHAKHGAIFLVFLYRLLLVVTTVSLVATAHGGGALVFDHGAGVKCFSQHQQSNQ